MHHQYYGSHYPRYYYRNKFAGISIDQIRGFNENQYKPMYWAHQTVNQVSAPVNTELVRKLLSTRPPQTAVYKGRSIGEPVKVRHEMRQPRQETRFLLSTPDKQFILSEMS